MSVKLTELTEQHLEVLSLKGGYIGSSESTLVKMPHCWKSHGTAQFSSHILLLSVSTLLVEPFCINLWRICKLKLL